MRKSIVRKVFLSTMIIFIITLVTQLIFQVYFVSDVYSWLKRIEIENDVDEVIEMYGTNYNAMTVDLFETGLIPLLTIDEKYVIQNDAFYDLFNYVLLDTNKGVYKVMIGDRVDEEGELVAGYLDLVVGNKVKFTGARFLEQNVILLDADISNPLYDGLISIEGEIIETHYIKKELGVFDYQPRKLLRETGNLVVDHQLVEGNIEFLEAETGLLIHLVIRKIGDNYGILMYTMENLSNTFSVVNQFYVYLFIVQIILLLVVSYVYTRWFTKPLKMLNNEAKAIAGLDFAYRSNIRTGDELEQLSKSLKQIAESMENTMEKLKKDARKKAESEERMRELLANLSHEYKTPLGIMSGFLEMIEADEEKKEYYLYTIREEIEKLNDLTKETLILCESENYESIKPIDIISLRDVCSTEKFVKKLEENELLLYKNIQDEYVVCDYRKIKIVMDNFMSNAIKYTDKGERIIISTMTIGNKIRCSIKNTGAKISDSELEKIWDTYYRVEKSRNKDYGGNGIGLAIAKNILEAHHSEYGVFNENNGVVFYFTLQKAENENLIIR